MKKRIIIYINLFLLIVIFLLLLKIFNKKDVLGVSINPISVDDVISSPSGRLKFFYEPKPFSQGEKVPSYMPYKAHYAINSDSLNERYEYNQKKEKGVFRIITLGDSFTYGIYVDTKDNWTELLEDELNTRLVCKNISKFEVINLGVYGYDSDYSVERFRRRGMIYSPDLVFWFQVVPTRINELITALSKKYYAEASRSGELKKQIAEGKYYENGLKAREQLIKSWGIDRVLNYQKRAMLAIKQYYLGPLVVMVHPSLTNREKEVMQETVKQAQGWQFFDGLENFIHENGFFKNDGHPNQKGHKIIADDIFNYLKNSGIMPCD